MLKPFKTSQLRLTAIIFAVAGLLVGVGFALFPPVGDDLQYAEPWRAYMFEGADADFGAVVDFLVDRYHCDNGRLANVVMTMLSPLPRWIGGMLGGLAVALTLWLGATLGGFAARRTSVCAWTAAILLLLPWYDQFYVQDFQLNYLWSCLLLLYLLRLTLRDGKSGVKSDLGVFFAALLLGLWHEGFGSPALCGIVGMMVLFSDMRGRRQWLAVAGLTLGSVYLMSAPGLLNRNHDALASFAGMMRMVYPYLALGVLYFLVLALSWWRRGMNPFRNKLAVFSSSVIVVSALATMLTQVGPRSFTAGALMALLGIVTTLSTVINQREKKKTTAVSLAIGYSLMTVHLVAVDAMCLRLSREYDATVAAWRDKPAEAVFVEMTLRRQAPAICLGKPYYDWFAHYLPMGTVSEFYYGTRMLLAVPARLRDFEPSKGVRIEGNSDVMAWQGYLVGPWLGPEGGLMKMADDYGHGAKQREYFIVPFRSEADGKLYSWYNPNRSDIDLMFAETPVRLDFVDADPAKLDPSDCIDDLSQIGDMRTR